MEEFQEQTNFFHYFIKRELPIISIIGIFLAVSKYFFGDGKDQNSVFISYISSIFVIFLLIILLLDAFFCIIKSMRVEFRKSGPEFIVSSIPYVGVILFISFIFMLVYSLSWISFSHPFETNLILLVIEEITGIAIAFLIALYIAIKIKNPYALGGIVFFTLLMVLPIGSFIDIQHSTSSQILYQPFSNAIWVVWLIPIIELSLVVAFIKLGYYMFTGKMPELLEEYKK